MARGVNKVILVGNLGNDPEVRYLPSGGAVANISVATTDSWRDKASGDRQERTEWHRVVLFNRLGEIAGQYLRKGAKIYIEGRLQTRKWQGQDGQDRYSTEIVATDMQMLDSRGGGNYDPASSPQPQGNYQNYDNRPPMNQGDNPGGARSGNAPPPPPAPPAPEEFDDDIPF